MSDPSKTAAEQAAERVAQANAHDHDFAGAEYELAKSLEGRSR